MEAKEKFEAARYFLEQMRKSALDTKVFIFNLDAFLSTSRSVTFVLQKEFSANPKFTAWYTKKQEEMRKDDLMKFFIEMRNVSIKEGSPKTQSVTTLSLFDSGVATESVSITVIHPDGAKEEFAPAQPSIPAKQITNPPPDISCQYFFLQRTDNDVVHLCEKYLEKLFWLIIEAKKLLTS